MPTLFVFLLKINIALLLFCAGYYLVLRHLTFYTLNRIYLVSAILFATAYPKINFSDFAQQHQQITKPVQEIVFNWQAPAEKFVSPLSQPNYWYWAEFVFWIGAALLALRLLVQLFSLYKLYRNSTASTIYGHDIRLVNGNSGPFSFWKSIYINPANHEQADLRSILLHEQVHINEWHTLDILLAELSTIFYWFNPGIWLMKKAIRENIEFITDRKILSNGIDTKQYQYSLVNVSFSAAPQGIVNHFNISTIKKRIIMMNAKRSSKVKLTRYAFLLPAVVVLLLIFSFSKAVIFQKKVKALKTTTAAVSSANFTNVNKTHPAVVKENTIEPAAAETNSGTRDTINPATNKINTHTGDTIYVLHKGKNIPVSFMVLGDHMSDSINYVVNGAKSTKAEFKKIDPSRIMSIMLLPADQANALFTNTADPNSKRKVLFVSTFDSETGKKLKEMMDKKLYPYNGGLGFSIHNPLKEEGNSGHLITDTSYDGPLTTWLPKEENKLYTNNWATFTSPPFGNSFSLNHLSDKLIIINGSIATETDLKKLSAFDIDRMVLKTDEETKELYGEKAKNGILFIVTKKNIVK